MRIKETRKDGKIGPERSKDDKIGPESCKERWQDGVCEKKDVKIGLERSSKRRGVPPL